MVTVTYRFPRGSDPERMGTRIAVGQTAGTWNANWGHRERAFRNHLARLVDTGEDADGYPLARVFFPHFDLEGDLGSLLTLIFGKYSMAGPIKVVDIELPEDFGCRPKVGLSGLRDMVGVHDRPFVMAIFKPALGLSPTEHGEVLQRVGLAGLDLIKDDEIMADLPTAPMADRLEAGVQALDIIEAETGRRPLYAVNLTGGGSPVVTRARELEDAGANALLLNGLSYGWHTVEQVRIAVDIPIFLHPAMAGALCGAPDHGFSYRSVLGTLAAHSGVDAVLYPAHYGSLPFDPNEEAAIRDLLRSRDVAPVPSAGIHPGVVPKVLADYGNDVVLNAGTGIMDHPSGPAEGVRAFFEALDLHREGVPFDVDTMAEGPLKIAIQTWGT
ncbi:MAG: 2,3-diketo-5-methylthiopentyl-1-phosphate enolase [Kiritimatiellia bacterium]|jgi:2,3-diketo-5-methylthiopentyl-1-phosphate enolase